MKETRSIQVYAANGAKVIIFTNKITHMYEQLESKKTIIKLMNDEGVLTDLSLEEIMFLINEANDNDAR